MKKKLNEEMRKEIIDELADRVDRVRSEFKAESFLWEHCRDDFDKYLYYLAGDILKKINKRIDAEVEDIKPYIKDEMQTMGADNKRQLNDIKLRITVLEQELINKNETK
jgi:hypothetical protein